MVKMYAAFVYIYVASFLYTQFSAQKLYNPGSVIYPTSYVSSAKIHLSKND